MRYLILVFIAISAACMPRNRIENAAAVPGPTQYVEMQDSYATVENFSLTLRSVQNRCILFAQQTDKSKELQEFDLGMIAPCEFIRPKKNNELQTFSYGKGSQKVTIAKVTGGYPNPNRKDKLMPMGCGTQTANIRVYTDRLKISPANESDLVRIQEFIKSDKENVKAECPSEWHDEVEFATW